MQEYNGPALDTAPEERGLLGESIAGFKRGGLRLVGMLGNVGRTLNPGGENVDYTIAKAGQGLKNWSDKRMQQQDVAPSSYIENHPILGNIPQAAEMVIPSVAVPLGAGLAATGVGAAPGIAIAASGLAGAGLFGVSQYQDVKDAGIKAGLSPEEARSAGIKSGLVEGLGEGLANLLPAAKVFNLAAPMKGAIVKSLFSNPSKTVLKQLGNNLAEIAASEVTTEMGQNYLEAKIDKDYGIRPDADPTQEAIDAIGPTLALSMLMTGPVSAANKLSRVATQKVLETPSASESARMQAVNNVHGALLQAEKSDVLPTGHADIWRQRAEEAVKNGEVVPIDDSYFPTFEPAAPAEKAKPEDTKADIHDALVQSLQTGESPLEVMAQSAADKIVAKHEEKAAAEVEAPPETMQVVHPQTGDIENIPNTPEAIAHAVELGYMSYDSKGSLVGDSGDTRFSRYPKNAPVEVKIADMQKEAGELEPRVEAAYQSGNQPLAERLDARLDGLYEQLDNILSEKEAETDAQSRHAAEPIDAEASLEESLADRYYGMVVNNLMKYDRSDAISNFRSTLLDHGATKAETASDEQILAAAKEAYDYVEKRGKGTRLNRTETNAPAPTEYFRGERPEGTAAGDAVFYSPSKDFASSFADGEKAQDMKGEVKAQQLDLAGKKIFDYENPEHRALLDPIVEGEGRNLLAEGDWALIESKEVQDAIKAAGFEGFHVSEEIPTNTGEMVKAKNVALYQGTTDRFSKVGDLTIRSIPKSIINKVSAMAEQKGKNRIVSIAGAMSFDDLARVSPNIWKAVDEKYGTEDAVRLERERLAGYYIKHPDRLGKTGTRFDYLAERNGNVIRRAHLAHFIMEHLNQTSDRFSRLTDADIKELNILRPALKVGTETHIGAPGEAHIAVAAKKGVKDAYVKGTAERGFVDSTGRFHGEAKAAEWLMKNDQDAYKHLKNKRVVDSVDYAYAKGLAYDAKFNRAESTGTPKAEIEKKLKDILPKLKIPVQILNDASEMPDTFKNPEGVSFNGVFHNGKIYLIASQLKSVEEAEAVLLDHEVRHAGLRAVLGGSYEPFMLKAYADQGNGIRGFAESKGIDFSTREGKLEAADEFIVSLAKEAKTHPLLDKIIAQIKEWLRNAGFDLRLSDAEFRALVSKAGAEMFTKDEQAGNMNMEPVTAFNKGEKDGFNISSWSVGDRLSELEKIYRDSKGKPVPPGSFRVSANISLRDKLAKVGGLFGYDVTLLANYPNREPDGFIARGLDPKHIYIFDSVEMPHLAVLGHELMHKMSEHANDLYKELGSAFIELKDDVALKYYLDLAHRGALSAEGNLTQNASEEWVADVVGRSMASEGFWKAFGEARPSLAARVAGFIHDMLASVHSMLGRAGLVENTVRDIRRAEKLTAEVMARFADRQEETRFNRLDDFKKFANNLSQNSFTKNDLARMMKNVGNTFLEKFMAVDRMIAMARGSVWAQPIASRLKELSELKTMKQQYAPQQMTDASVHKDTYLKAFKTDEDFKKGENVIFKATLYQLDPFSSLDDQWKDGEWKPVENNRFAPALTIEDAKADLASAFKKLNPAQREAVKIITDHIQKTSEAQQQAVLDKLKAVYGPDEQGFKDAEKAVKEQIKSLRGRYFPLIRFGNYMTRVWELDAEGNKTKEVSAQKFETMGEALKAKAAAEAKGYHAENDVDMEAVGGNYTNVPSNFITKVEAKASEAGIEGDALTELKQELQKLWVGTLSPNTIEGHKLPRKGVEGFETDILRTYAAYVSREARATANTKYGWQISRKYREMNNVIDELKEPGKNHDPEALLRMQNLVNHLESTDQHRASEKINPFVQWMNKLVFATMLSSPSAFVVQFSQPLMFTLPKLASRHGFAKASTTLYQATKKYMSGEYADKKIDAWDREHGDIGANIVKLIERHREIDAEVKRHLEVAGRTVDPAALGKALTVEARKEKAQIEGALKAIYEAQDAKGKEMLVLRVGVLMGSLELSRSHDLHDMVMGASKLEETINKGIETAGFFMRKGETGSRKAAAVSAFKLGYDGDFIKAMDYTLRDIIDDTLYDFSQENRPAVMRGNVGRLIGQFQFFRFHTIGKVIQLSMDALGKDFKTKIEAAKGDEKLIAEAKQVRAEARKELAYMTGVSMALAGAAGAPLAMVFSNSATKLLMSAIAWMFEDPDDPWDFERDFSVALHSALGDTAANVFEKGLPTLLGVDISRRVGTSGMADMIMGEPPEGMTASQRSSWYANRLLGPWWSMVGDWQKSVSAVADGDMGDAVKFASPNFVKSFFKAYDLEENGVTTTSGKALMQPEDVTMYSVALMLVGINPMDVSLAREDAREISNLSTTLTQRRSKLLKDYARAYVKDDYDGKEEALEKINAWGESQPRLKLSYKELASAVKRARQNAQGGKVSKKEQIIMDQYGLGEEE